MTTLTKHLKPEIKVNSRTRLQMIKDHQAVIKALAADKAMYMELAMIALFGGSLVTLCLSLAQSIVNKGMQ